MTYRLRTTALKGYSLLLKTHLSCRKFISKTSNERLYYDHFNFNSIHFFFETRSCYIVQSDKKLIIVYTLLLKGLQVCTQDFSNNCIFSKIKALKRGPIVSENHAGEKQLMWIHTPHFLHIFDGLKHPFHCCLRVSSSILLQTLS